MAIATGTALAIGALASAGTSTYAAHKRGQAETRASAAAEKNSGEELAFLREQAELDRAERSEDRGMRRSMMDFQRSETASRHKRAAPYRAYGQHQLNMLAGLTNPAGGYKGRTLMDSMKKNPAGGRTLMGSMK